MLKVPRSEFYFNPSEIIILVGVQVDSLTFGIKPAFNDVRSNSWRLFKAFRKVLFGRPSIV